LRSGVAEVKDVKKDTAVITGFAIGTAAAAALVI
jgi:hypothetical protein